MDADAKRNKRLKTGAILLALAAFGLIFISVAIFEQRPDIHTEAGRLQVAGGLANWVLSLLWIFIALYPLRRGEKWAFWTCCLPLLLYGIPMMALDAMTAEKTELISTLTPQAIGLLITLTGLALAAPGVFRKEV